MTNYLIEDAFSFLLGVGVVATSIYGILKVRKTMKAVDKSHANIPKDVARNTELLAELDALESRVQGSEKRK